MQLRKRITIFSVFVLIFTVVGIIYLLHRTLQYVYMTRKCTDEPLLSLSNLMDQVDALPDIVDSTINMGYKHTVDHRTDEHRVEIMIFRTEVEPNIHDDYELALSTMRCYAAKHSYRLHVIYDEKIREKCPHKVVRKQSTKLYFRKHCAVAKLLTDKNNIEWLLVLDADTAVVNPDHHIEEYIDDRVSFVFYERFHNWEVVAGNYLVKNTPFTINFLMEWSSYDVGLPKGFNNYDNGALHLLILKTLLKTNSRFKVDICEKLWRRGSINEDEMSGYFEFITCFQTTLGAKRLWEPHIKIMPRAQAWAIDWEATGGRWCSSMFMLHAVKTSTFGIAQSNGPIPNECGIPSSSGIQWRWSQPYRRSCTFIRKQLAKQERLNQHKLFDRAARTATYLRHPQLPFCWPQC